mmetsp:Transcript_12137/g.21750  ORF Transcript_12137/g.21750 Transcript_12137/m.21750 type:complete len:272 (-) Transcript_12137:668-1483(-)
MSDSERKDTTKGKRIAEASHLCDGDRLHIVVDGRYVTVINELGKLYAIDSVCFHAGGPLGIGDIEEINGRKCITCPWHNYKIDLQSGDKYYQSVNFVDGKMIPGEWKSNGIQQRTHEVYEQDGGIYVTLSTFESDGRKIDSDHYACDERCGERMVKNRNGGSSHGHSHGGLGDHGSRGKLGFVGADGKFRSGISGLSSRSPGNSNHSRLGPPMSGYGSIGFLSSPVAGSKDLGRAAQIGRDEADVDSDAVAEGLLAPCGANSNCLREEPDL